MSPVELESGNFGHCRIVKPIVDPYTDKPLASKLQAKSNGRREKDGLWAVLAWLSILAHVNKDQNRNLFEKVAKAAPGGRPPTLSTSPTHLLLEACPKDGVYDATGGDADRSLCPSLLLVVVTSYPA